MEKNYTQLSIREIQGDSVESTYGGESILTTGVVTGILRRGFFLQTPNVEWDEVGSDGVFVFSPEWNAEVGVALEVQGEVVNYLKHETAKPVTQIHLEQVRPLPASSSSGIPLAVRPIVLTRKFLNRDNLSLADLLNSLEGMLVSIKAGQTFISPSNPFGDYVLALDSPDVDRSVLRSENRGVLTDHENHLRWFPGFRITNYNHAQRLNVGATLQGDIVGPLNYRVDSYQIVQSGPISVDPAFVSLSKSTLQSSPGSLTIMTLNCFNLDPHIEAEEKVMNPRQDIDDDWGEGRFHTLAQAIALQANTPDIVALQEIQDNDGAELTDVVDASRTYELLIRTVEELSGLAYAWVDVNPELGADGGQPGGNIRNAYLYNPKRVKIIPEKTKACGRDNPAFEGSRKPLLVVFEELSSHKQLACINVHLASKRHQNSIFAPLNPGVDEKLAVRVAQASHVADELELLRQQKLNYYVTGDFNDTEHSETLKTLIGNHSANLVMSLPEEERYDYNHRGKLQVLMHGVIPIDRQDNADYEIIHGNELIGVTPGEESDKPSDHAYVIAKLKL